MKLSYGLDITGYLLMLAASSASGLIIHNTGWYNWQEALTLFISGIIVGMVFKWMGQSLHALQNINLCISRMDYRQHYGEEMPRD